MNYHQTSLLSSIYNQSTIINTAAKLVRLYSTDLANHSWLHYHLGSWLEVLHNQSISNSQLFTILIAQNNAARRTACSWRIFAVTRLAARTPMNQKIASSTHYTQILGYQRKGARSFGRLMHFIHAPVQFIGRGWERSRVDHALL